MSTSPDSPEHEISADARAIMRAATTASLATVEPASGHPYASLITVAGESDGTPLFLISRLARHTANLESDPRASILFLETGGLSGRPDSPADPLARARVSTYGRAEIAGDDAAERRFLARHPEAVAYAKFADFFYYRLVLEGAHYVGGFGAIHDLGTDDLLTDIADAGDLIDAEAGIIAHMNDDHADAVEIYATALLGEKPGPWRMTGCDPEGCDLATAGRSGRLVFPARVTTPAEVRKTLVALVEKARTAGP